MRNLYSAFVLIMGLYFTGTVANTPGKSGILFNSERPRSGDLGTNGSRNEPAISLSSGFVADQHVASSQASALGDGSLDVFRLLCKPNVNREHWSIRQLDLSNRLVPTISLRALAHMRGLEVLNLSNSAIRTFSLALPRLQSSWAKPRRSRRILPLLKELILQRNQLSDTPRDLWQLGALQSLDLSFNRISRIGLTDFQNCLHLERLYLKSNKIVRIHPEAFRNLKKLQVVDLSGNALTKTLPMMAIALELPRLQVNLADNQWQCDSSVALFQDFISQSWRKTWNEICKFTGNEAESSWIPKSRISRETHLPHTNGNHMQARQPQEGTYMSVSTSEKPQHVGSVINERRRRSRSARSTRHIQTPARKEGLDASSQDLILAICLSVSITFFLAFCLGALARPYIDRLWQQRCRRKGPTPKRTYSNEGFYDEIEVVGNRQPRAVFPNQVFQNVNLYENQGAFSAMPRPRSAGAPAGAPESGSAAPDGRPRPARRGDNSGAGASASPVTVHRHPGADTHQAAPEDPSELHYDTVAQEEPRAADEASGRPGAPLGFPEEAPMSTYMNFQRAQEAAHKGMRPGDEPSAYSSVVTVSDQGHAEPPVLPPRRSSSLDGPPACKQPLQDCAPWETQCVFGSESDSDAGSLFTLSSLSTEGPRSEEEDPGGAGSQRACGSPATENSAQRIDTTGSQASLEDELTFQDILRKFESRGARLEKPLVSDAGPGLWKAHQQRAPSSNKLEDLLSLPGSRANSPVSVEVPGTFIYDHVIAPPSERAEWHRSLRDLDLADVDIYSGPVEPPSPPDLQACQERDAGIYKYEARSQGIDTVQQHTPRKISDSENVRPSRQDSTGTLWHATQVDITENEDFVFPPEEEDPRTVLSLAPLGASCGAEPALRCDRDKGARSQDCSEYAPPMFQKLPSPAASLQPREPFADGERADDAENRFRLEDDSPVYAQRQTQPGQQGAGALCEERIH
ncbi:leucine-rich repeat-containing protein 66 [Tenrec ecaudatus]|uniref:leucine-rich repeat-containing protein 66 n=1 Tax=Tenrec ecaudatus TaxID=94439 RepID=UPI003F592147